MHKAENGQVLSYISDIIPPLVRETTHYPLRNQNDITILRCRTKLFRNSCIPSSVSIWNNLDENIRNSSSFASFKYALKQINTIKVPAYYIKGDRYLSVMHARHQDNMSVCFIPPYTPFYVAKLGFTGLYIFFLFWL